MVELLPAIVHFVWIGGEIPAEDLDSMLKLATLLKPSGFVVNCWVDDEKNYRKALERARRELFLILPDIINGQNLDEYFGIKIRSINELKVRMEGEDADCFYTGNDKDFPILSGQNRAKIFWKYVNVERIGLKNLAAAVDLLRLEILRQEGGYYIDTDRRFYFGKDEMLSTFSPASPAFGILFDLHYNKIERDPADKSQITSVYFGGNNDVIGSMSNHFVLRDAIITCLANYIKLEQKSVENTLYSSFFKSPAFNNLMDVKRLPASIARRNLTIELSGPGLLCEAFSRYWHNQPDRSWSSLRSTSLYDAEGEPYVLGIPIESNCAMTWLKKQKERSFDAESLALRMI